MRGTGGGATPAGRERWACLLDWDGTVTIQDAQVLLLDAFGRPDWAAVEDEVYAGGLGSRAAYPLIYEGFRLPAEEVAAFVRKRVRLDPTFPAFARFCLDHGVPLQVVSDGQRFYIELLLADAGLDRLPVAANNASYTASGVRLAFVEPPGGCGLCGNCKREWVDAFHRQGYRVLYAGDGRTDRCAARRADAVFARGYLLGFCRAEGIACTPLKGFTEMEVFLRQALGKDLERSGAGEE
ncbi:MAG: MtnX-like HAD-IB family phosphatase [Bacillota bacterium]|nr:MtnX-like HAD-IB family phosphatase [Bacillota bacterium]